MNQNHVTIIRGRIATNRTIHENGSLAGSIIIQPPLTEQPGISKRAEMIPFVIPEPERAKCFDAAFKPGDIIQCAGSMVHTGDGRGVFLLRKLLTASEHVKTLDMLGCREPNDRRTEEELLAQNEELCGVEDWELD